MKTEEFNQLPQGLYRITWSDGSTGQAAIGETSDGGRWLACTHWFTLGPRPRAIESIRGIERILVTGQREPQESEKAPGRPASPLSNGYAPGRGLRRSELRERHKGNQGPSEERAFPHIPRK